MDGEQVLLFDTDKARSVMQLFRQGKACLGLAAYNGHTLLAGQKFQTLPQIEDEPQPGEFPIGDFLLNVFAAVVIVVAVVAVTAFVAAAFSLGGGIVLAAAAAGTLAGGSILMNDFNSGNASDMQGLVEGILKTQAIVIGAQIIFPQIAALPFLKFAKPAFDVLGAFFSKPAGAFTLGAGINAGMQAMVDPYDGKMKAGCLLSSDAWMEVRPRQAVGGGMIAIAAQQAVKAAGKALFEPKWTVEQMDISRDVPNTETGMGKALD